MVYVHLTKQSLSSRPRLKSCENYSRPFMDYALSALRDAYLSSLPVMDKRNRPISTSNTNFTFSRYFGLKVVIDCS